MPSALRRGAHGRRRRRSLAASSSASRRDARASAGSGPGASATRPGRRAARPARGVGSSRAAASSARSSVVERVLAAAERPRASARGRSSSGGRATRVGGRVDLAERLRAASVDGARGVARAVVVARRRGSRRSTAVGAGARRGVGHAVPQLERALEERGRLAVGVDASAARPAPHGGRERGGLVAGGGVVVRDRGGEPRAARPAGDAAPRARRRARGAARRARPGSRSSYDDLAQQRVAERVARRRRRRRAMWLGDRLAQRVAQLARRRAPLASPSSRVVERGWPTASERAATSCAGAGQALDAEHQRVAQRLRQRAAAVERRPRAAPR